MYNSNDILKMLREGKSADAIARELTDAINNAEATYNAEKTEAERKRKEEEAAKVKAENDKKLKIIDCEVIIDAIHGYFNKWYPNLVSKEIWDEISAEDLAYFIDDTVNEVKDSIATINKLFPSGVTSTIDLNVNPNKSTPKTVKNADDAINLFFKNFEL